MTSSPSSTGPVTRVGIVAKRAVRAASDHLDRLAAWLREREIDAVFETETAALAGSGTAAPSHSRDELQFALDMFKKVGTELGLI